jgi:hypothetical protein
MSNMPREIGRRQPDTVHPKSANRRLRHRNKRTSAIDGSILDATGSVAAGAAQREGFERGQLTVRSDHVVISDLDRGDAAAL